MRADDEGRQREYYGGPITPGAAPGATDPVGPGLTCPACGCHHFRVVYTRRAPRGRILRRRECRHCGRRLSTVEHERQT